MLNSIVVTIGVGLLAFSSLPLASAAKVCEKDAQSGEDVCRETLPVEAKVAIAVVSVMIVFLMLVLFLFIRRNRKAAAEADKDYAVEASQVTGPPTVLAATYTPETGHSLSRMYGIGTAGSDEGRTPALPPNAMPTPNPISSTLKIPDGMSATGAWQAPNSPAPRSPAPRHGPFLQPPQTAPAHKNNFANTPVYPFSGFGSSNAGDSSPGLSQPKSAFVSSGGFPRPLLAGRLKDRIRDRPPSISSLSSVRM
jgi:hypothetical protein